jgi:hypothetical protein
LDAQLALLSASRKQTQTIKINPNGFFLAWILVFEIRNFVKVGLFRDWAYSSIG